jgi:hypothetical protein
MGHSNNLDIWGNSPEDVKECFLCGSEYIAGKSSAPEEYRGTFCSEDCYNYNNEQMQKAIEAEERFASTLKPKITRESDSKSPTESSIDSPTSPNTREVKIGDFVFRVKKEGE